jgi:hypothetical protein
MHVIFGFCEAVVGHVAAQKDGKDLQAEAYELSKHTMMQVESQSQSVG